MGDTPTGKVVGTVAPGIVMAIAVFMILQELQIAEGIVIITYAAIMGALALAAALAFGLGGREVAARMLEGAYQNGQESREQVKRDLQQGKENAKREVESMRDEERGRQRRRRPHRGRRARRPARARTTRRPSSR